MGIIAYESLGNIPRFIHGSSIPGIRPEYARLQGNWQQGKKGSILWTLRANCLVGLKAWHGSSVVTSLLPRIPNREKNNTAINTHN